jgi:dTDP-4-amino-4,6-dideoxygalactose transaminase
MMTASIRIPFIDLKSQFEGLNDEITETINTIIHGAEFTLGDRVEQFEQAFADYCGVEYAIGVGSGTDALHLALRGYGIGPGDEVITVPNTFIATVEAIQMCGARPVLVDVDRDTYLIDVEQLERSFSSRTKAVIPVHLYGHPVEMSQIRALCDEYGVRVIEDACQAHGASVGDIKTGALGDAACFSFYPSKNLGGAGDGGIVVTNDLELKNRVERLRNHGENGKHNHVESGYCSRLHGLQAGILNVKLKHLDGWNESRRVIADIYDSFFEHSPIAQPYIKSDRYHAYHLYVIQVQDRDLMKMYLTSRGIDTAIHYPIPIHLQPAFRHLGYRRGSFPIAEMLANKIISLPMYPELKVEDANRVAYEVLEFAYARFRAA